MHLSSVQMDDAFVPLSLCETLPFGTGIDEERLSEGLDHLAATVSKPQLSRILDNDRIEALLDRLWPHNWIELDAFRHRVRRFHLNVVNPLRAFGMPFVPFAEPGRRQASTLLYVPYAQGALSVELESQVEFLHDCESVVLFLSCDDVLGAVFEFLDPFSLYRIGFVSRLWRDVSRQDWLWAPLLRGVWLQRCIVFRLGKRWKNVWRQFMLIQCHQEARSLRLTDSPFERIPDLWIPLFCRFFPESRRLLEDDELQFSGSLRDDHLPTTLPNYISDSILGYNDFDRTQLFNSLPASTDKTEWVLPIRDLNPELTMREMWVERVSAPFKLAELWQELEEVETEEETCLCCLPVLLVRFLAERHEWIPVFILVVRVCAFYLLFKGKTWLQETDESRFLLLPPMVLSHLV